MAVPAAGEHAPWSAGLERLALASRRWPVRLAAFAVTAAAFIVYVSDSPRPWQAAARLALTALLLLNGMAGLGEVTIGLRRVAWERWGRFARLRHAAPIGGALLILLGIAPGLIFLYPQVRSTPLVGIMIALALVVLALAIVALVLLAVVIVFVLLALPVLLTRTLVRRRRRRAYGLPDV